MSKKESREKIRNINTIADVDHPIIGTGNTQRFLFRYGLSMSTASKPTESTENRAGHYAKFDEYVNYQISKTGSNIKANDLLTTGVGISTIILGYLLIFVICDHWIIKGGFGHTSRLLMLAGVVLASLGWAIWKLIIPYFKKVTRLYSAHALEQSSDEMEGSLLNLIDLKKSNRPVNPAIINSLEKKPL